MKKKPDSSAEEKKILKKSVFYSFALYIRMGIKILQGLFVAKFLGPSLYGLRNAFDLTIEYESYSDLGSLSAINRQIPYYRGREELGNERLAEASVFGVNFIYALCVGIMLIGVSFYLKGAGWEQKYSDFVFFFGLIIITNKVKYLYSTKLKYDNKFYLLSMAEMLYGFSSAVLCVSLTYLYSFRGLLTGLFTADLVFISYVLFKIKEFPSLRISFPLLRELIKIGFPIMVVGFLLTLMRSADRIVILAMLSEKALGYFSVATIATGIIVMVPSAIRQVTLSPMMEKLGRTNDIFRIKNYLTDPTVLIACSLPFLLAVIFFGIHLPVQYFLTKYYPAITIVKILTLGSYFAALTMMPLSLCFALNKQMKLIYLIVPAVVVNFVLNYIFVRLGWGVNGIAIGTCISYFLFTNMLFFYSLRLFRESFLQSLKFILLTYAPFIYTILLIYCLERIIQVDTTFFWDDIFYSSLKIVVFSVGYSIIFIFFRKHPAVTKLIDNVPLFANIRDKLSI